MFQIYLPRARYLVVVPKQEKQKKLKAKLDPDPFTWQRQATKGLSAFTNQEENGEGLPT